MKISGNTFCRLLGVAVLASCKVADPFLPTPDNMVGTYTARQLIAVMPDSAIDWLAGGASLTLTLSADSKSSGRFFLPASLAGGTDLDADMAGTWLLYGYTLVLAQDAESFVRHMDFTAQENRLAGDQTMPDGVRIIVILTK